MLEMRFVTGEVIADELPAPAGLVVEPLADLFPDAVELASTRRYGAVGLMSNLSPRQMRRQRCSARCRLEKHEGALKPAACQRNKSG